MAASSACAWYRVRRRDVSDAERLTRSTGTLLESEHAAWLDRMSRRIAKPPTPPQGDRRLAPSDSIKLEPASGLFGLNSNQPAERSRPADRAPLKLEGDVVVEIVDRCAGAGRTNSRRTAGYDRDLALYLAHRVLPFCLTAVSRVHDF